MILDIEPEYSLHDFINQAWKEVMQKHICNMDCFLKKVDHIKSELMILRIILDNPDLKEFHKEAEERIRFISNGKETIE
jgi:hypothetical protein